MAHNPTTSKPNAFAPCNNNMITVAEYEPNIGAPFRVILVDSVQQKYSKMGDLIETVIPNLDGLLKEVAFARSLDTRKFSPEDIKFVRKAIGLKAVDLAELLGVSPEHISRCEKGDRVLSVAAEKLLRVIILKRRHNPAVLANCLSHIMEGSDTALEKKKKIISLIEKYKRTVEEIESAIFDFKIQTVHSTGDLCFEFELVQLDADDPGVFDETSEEEWRPSDKIAA